MKYETKSEQTPMTKSTIGLPTGFRDVIFDEARSRRRIEQQFAEVFDKRGFGEISPSGVEYLDVYTRGRQSIKDITFKFLDRDDNLLALRADFTPAIARVVSSGVLAEEVPYRIWYSGNVFRKADVHRGRFHEFRQIGAELLGTNSIERDVEVLQVALACLSSAGIKNVYLHLNHAGIFRGIIKSLSLDPDALRQVKTEIDRKDVRRVALRLQDFGVARDVQRQVDAICRCVGTREDLLAARKAIDNPEAASAMDELLELSSRLSSGTENIVFDLTEIDEMEYYTGVMFAFFSPKVSTELGRGGRYDTLLREFGRSMPAVGFSFSLDNLVSLL
jgi:ATP phosphoribosyltransferase regulatory subunit